MMNTLILLKATKEMVKQFSSIKKENEYNEKCIEMLCKTFDLKNEEGKFLLKLSNWDAYSYEGKFVDFIILWKDNKIKCRASHNQAWWKYVEYNTIYEINENENLRYIFYQLENIDEYYWK